MSRPVTISADTIAVDGIVDRWNADPEFAVEMLQDVQKRFRHLPKPALERVAERTGADLARLYHIATFFKVFSLTPRGRTPIQVCTGTACHVQGSARVLDAFSRFLGIEPGGTTGDLEYSLEGVRCLGCCGLAPVVTIGPDLIGGVDSSKVGKLMRRHRKQVAQAVAGATPEGGSGAAPSGNGGAVGGGAADGGDDD
jgi:NADH-quinone oxidoreductase subunit E